MFCLQVREGTKLGHQLEEQENKWYYSTKIEIQRGLRLDIGLGLQLAASTNRGGGAVCLARRNCTVAARSDARARQRRA